MKFERRITKLEQQAPAMGTDEWHTVIVKPDQNADQQIEEYRKSNKVGPNADFWIVEAVKSNPRRFEHETERNA